MAAEVFDAVDSPQGYFANIGAYGGDVEEEEDGSHQAADPDDDAIDLFDGYVHHALHIGRHECPEIQLRGIDVCEGQLLGITHDIVVHEV